MVDFSEEYYYQFQIKIMIDVFQQRHLWRQISNYENIYENNIKLILSMWYEL